MSYDYIVVGGGTAGCLIASRLSNALPDKKVLVLEAGRNHTEYPHVLIPGHYLQFLTSEDMSFTAVSVPQSHLGNREITIPLAKLLGGGSCANFMTWARGPKCDWDEWAARTGDDIYKWDNILPLLNDVPIPNPYFNSGALISSWRHLTEKFQKIWKNMPNQPKALTGQRDLSV